MRAPAEALRAAYPQALATLVRIVGSLDAAQDALQEASVRALKNWRTEVPRNPAAWLVRAGHGVAVDWVRHGRVQQRHADQVQRLQPEVTEPVEDDFRSDMLRLIFTCCHPALSPDSQVALTLRTVIGLSVQDIARLYLVSPAAMERRLVRARKTLHDAAIPYEVPRAEDLSPRLAAACAVVLVVFNDGYSHTADSPQLRPRLCVLAIRLGRLLSRLFRREAEVSGLLALMLLQHARMPARVVTPGVFVSLQHEDRTLWDAALIREGEVMVQRALMRRALGPYQIQAAIAAVHCAADTYERTDWGEIAALYEVLVRYQPTATVKLNRAVAVSKVRGPHEGLAALAGLEESLAEHHLYHAVRAHLLQDADELDAARQAYQRARQLAQNPIERDYLDARIDKLRPLH